MRILILVAAFALPTSAFATNLDLGGSCPGVATLTVTEVTPGSNVFVVTGDAPGTMIIPSGPCADTALSVTGSLAKYGPLSDSDGDGAFAASPTLPDAACSLYFQIIDMGDCSVSEVASFSPGAAGECEHNVDADDYVAEGALGIYCDDGGDAHWTDYGDLTFEECECIANRTGLSWAVGDSSPVIAAGGWLGDDLDASLATITSGSWPDESTADRDSLQRCVLATWDERTAPTEFPIEETYVDEDGQTWHYWHFTAQTSSQVHAFAATVGGRIINPASVGLGATPATTGFTHWCSAAAEFNGGGNCNSDNICTHYVGYFE